MIITLILEGCLILAGGFALASWILEPWDGFCKTVGHSFGNRRISINSSARKTREHDIYVVMPDGYDDSYPGDKDRRAFFSDQIRISNREDIIFDTIQSIIRDMRKSAGEREKKVMIII